MLLDLENEKCPFTWAGQFHDRNRHRSVVAKVVARRDLYFWHVFLRCPRSWNDKAIQGVSGLSPAYLHSLASTVTSIIGGIEFTDAFPFADGIDPSYAWLMKTVALPRTPMEITLCEETRGGLLLSTVVVRSDNDQNVSYR